MGVVKECLQQNDLCLSGGCCNIGFEVEEFLDLKIIKFCCRKWWEVEMWF